MFIHVRYPDGTERALLASGEALPRAGEVLELLSGERFLVEAVEWRQDSTEKVSPVAVLSPAAPASP